MVSLVGSRRTRLVLLSGALAVALAIPATVNADTTAGAPSIGPASARDATIQVTSVAVTARVIATANLTFTCQPFQVYDWDTGQTIESTAGSIEGGGVTILQAQGRTLDWGQAEIFGGAAVCDGTTVNQLAVPVSAAVSPWKTGTAVVGASIFVSDALQFQDSDSASSGPISFRLSGH